MLPERVVCVGWEAVVWWWEEVWVGRGGEAARRERRERGRWAVGWEVRGGRGVGRGMERGEETFGGGFGFWVGDFGHCCFGGFGGV